MPRLKRHAALEEVYTVSDEGYVFPIRATHIPNGAKEEKPEHMSLDLDHRVDMGPR